MNNNNNKMEDLKEDGIGNENSTLNLRERVDLKTIEDPNDIGVRLTDELEGLECFCADNPQSIYQTQVIPHEILDDFEMKIKGYVFDGDKLIFKSKPFPTIVRDIKHLENHLDFGMLYDYDVYVMKEGTCIRVFFYNDKWFITTTRKLNAFNSKWGPESFGEIFTKMIEEKTGNSLDDFLNSLDRDLNYVFLIGTTNVTRIVCKPYSNVSLMYVMNKSHEIVRYAPLENWYIKPINVSLFTELNEILKGLEVLEDLKEFKNPFKDGFGLYLESRKDGNAFKLENEEYARLAKLRNNFPSIGFAYLNLFFEDEKKKEFIELYSDFKEHFNNYNKEVEEIINNIYNYYHRKFVKKEEFRVSKYESNIIYHVHGVYLANRKPITKEDIYNVISSLPISNVNKIISEKKRAKKLADKFQSHE
jgi:hypothetical protein